MNQKKSLQELTFKDNFMFGAVMLNPENCKGVIERCIGTEIECVEVSKEKSIVYNPEYKGGYPKIAGINKRSKSESRNGRKIYDIPGNVKG